MRPVLIAALALSIASAVTPARADDAGRLKLAHQIVVVTHATDRMKAVLPVLMQQMRPMLLHQAPADKVDAFLKSFTLKFDSQAETFTGLVAEVYAREFSEDDLTNLLAFYNTAAGQHLIAKQNEINQAMLKAGQQWGGLIAKQVLDDFQKQKDATLPKL